MRILARALASESSFRTTSAGLYAEIHLKEKGTLSLEDER
jgi:hypothetical protein